MMDGYNYLYVFMTHWFPTTKPLHSMLNHWAVKLQQLNVQSYLLLIQLGCLPKQILRTLIIVHFFLMSTKDAQGVMTLDTIKTDRLLVYQEHVKLFTFTYNKYCMWCPWACKYCSDNSLYTLRWVRSCFAFALPDSFIRLCWLGYIWSYDMFWW